MATLTSLGIGSGIDTASMLESLKVSEQTRLTPYTNLQSSYQAKISAWGQISSSLEALNKSAKSLQSEAFNTLNVSSNKAFTATATSNAQADTHEVTVEQLAVAHKLRTEPQDGDTLLGDKTGNNSRMLIITQDNGTELKVDLKDDETSLSQVAKAINKQNGDVTASVQRTADGDQLVLSSKTTGENSAMSVRVEGDEALDDVLNSDNMITVAEAKDSKVRVDGTTFTRSTNNINDILPGVTLELKAVSEDAKSEQLTLTKNTTQIKTTIQDFVKNYNALIAQTNSASKYVQNDTSGLTNNDVAKPNSENGALMGDSTLRGMVKDIKSTVNGVYGENDADYTSLADIGITIDSSTGLMTLNESKLDEAIAANPDDIANTFMDRNGNEGLATKLDGIITSYIGDSDAKVDGVIKITTDSLEDYVERVKVQIDKTQALIDAQVERYRVQFQNLDKTMSNLNSVSNQLSALISSL